MLGRSSLALPLALAGCVGAVTPPPPDPAVVQEIGTVCEASGLFEAADGTLTMFLPAATLPVDVLNAGVDVVCANPAQFAGDIAAVNWLVRNLNAYLVQKAGTSR